MPGKHDMPLVTIAIPFYNNEETIIDAVKSVFGQTYPHWELLLLDDGSTDGSLDRVRKVVDVRVRIVHDGVNRGLIHRLNQIPSLAKGQYIARMDGDDMMHPMRIAKQVEMMLSDKQIDLVDTGAYTIDQKANPVGKRGLEPIETHLRNVLRKSMTVHGSVMAKKSWFLENPYDGNYERAEDYELWCRTSSVSNFARVQEPLYIHREGKVNIANYRKSMRTLRRVFRTYGPSVLSPLETTTEILKTYLKSGIYTVAGGMGLQDRLSAMRNIPLEQPEKDLVMELIKTIRAIELPLRLEHKR